MSTVAALITRIAATAAVVVCLTAGASGQTTTPAQPAPSTSHRHGAGEESPTQDPQAPPITDADRGAAFPDVPGHAVHDTSVHAYVLFDQLEWQRGGGQTGFNWDNRGWIGGDRDRFYFRTEGEGEDGSVDTAHAHLLYGRAIAPWWDLVAGARQDFRPGDAQ